jgi:hypothetical protein
MRPFKQQLLDLLRERGWDLVSRDSDTDWWAEEHWLIRSVRENWGQEIVLSFLVYPGYEGGIKRRAIWEVGATTEVPQDYLEAQAGIACMSLHKGKFNENLRAFVDQLDQHRRKAGESAGRQLTSDSHQGRKDPEE